jgi:sulfur-carrier protein
MAATIQPAVKRFWSESRMKINFFATLRQITGQKTVEFDVPPETAVMDLVELVVTRFPPMRAELLDENGNLYRHVHVFVNGRDAPYLSNGLATIIQPNDVVNIFPAVGGG